MMEMQEVNGIDDEKAELSGKVFSIEKQKRFVEFQKDVKKYVIFVLALPLIGAVGLSIYGALNYEFDLKFVKTETLPSSNVTNCQPGWYGESCDKEVIKCSLDTCSGNGQCEDKQNGFFCKCNPGWKGERCQNTDDCQSNLCLNQGICYEKENDFGCQCQEYWVGKTCEGIDYCKSRPCKNKGSCTNKPEMNSFKCQCQTPFEGQTCTKSYLKEIKMIVNDGGKGKVWLQLQQPSQLQRCAMEIKEISSGGTLTWSGENLGDCKNFKFDATIASIDYWIKADEYDEFCPTSVELVLSDDQNTSYFLDNMNCNYSKNTNWRKHTAKIQ